MDTALFPYFFVFFSRARSAAASDATRFLFLFLASLALPAARGTMRTRRTATHAQQTQALRQHVMPCLSLTLCLWRNEIETFENPVSAWLDDRTSGQCNPASTTAETYWYKKTTRVGVSMRLIAIYNLLPKYIVAAKTAKEFQRQFITSEARRICRERSRKNRCRAFV